MISRFQIEDLIAQDETGVIFRAIDTETEKTVAVRRFFPFGVDGGGLQAEEQSAYNIAVGRLAGLNHPAMRSIIYGGCDPVDGMPFLTTEWIEGKSLQSYVVTKPLSAETATALVTQAMEVCELLSHVLAEEAVWVETELDRIIVGDENSGRGATFWISPLKWLGGRNDTHGLNSIVALTENILGWQNKRVPNHAGNGLGGWLNWLRKNATTTTLKEARETLAASIGVPPPPGAKTILAKSAIPTKNIPVKRAPTKSKAAWYINISIAMLVIGLGGWGYQRYQSKQQPEAPTNDGELQTDTGALLDNIAKIKAKKKADELRSHQNETNQKNAVILAQQKEIAQKNGGVIQWDHTALILENENIEAVVEGVLKKTYLTEKKASLYLLFSTDPDKDEFRGTITTNKAPKNLSEDALTLLINKKIRIRGTVKSRNYSGNVRPEIDISDFSAIEVVK
ncbi:MAG: hypothetical protein H8M99_10535 [Gloeobacteraceae cyanobacterium ES-bin-144]|nr:hypothetical protein [Verrucomicrobiales bacterium]